MEKYPRFYALKRELRIFLKFGTLPEAHKIIVESTALYGTRGGRIPEGVLWDAGEESVGFLRPAVAD